MATRSTVKITYPGSESQTFYHHYDGYISGVGRKLARLFRNGHDTFKSIIQGLDSEFEPTEHHTEHGDIQYHYNVILSKSKNDGKLIVRYLEVWQRSLTYTGDYTEWAKETYTLQKFRDDVAYHIRVVRERIRGLGTTKIFT